MELKRRQQAYHERERKTKEADALKARILEYAAHADEDEEEFGASAARSDGTAAAPANAAAATPSVADDVSGGGEPATAPDTSSGAARAAGSAAAVAPAPASTVETTASNVEGGGVEGRSESGQNVDSDVGGTVETSTLPGSGGGGDLSGSGAGDASSAVVEEGSDATATGAVAGAPDSAGDEEGKADAVGVPAAQLSDSPASSSSSSAPLAAPRPRVVKTYGYKTRDAGGELDATSTSNNADEAQETIGLGSAAAAASKSTAEEEGACVDGGGGAVSLESQALWEEEEGGDEPGFGTEASFGGGDSCGFSLGILEEGGDGGGAEDDDESAALVAQEVSSPPVLIVSGEGESGEDKANAEAGTKRKLAEAKLDDCGEKDGEARRKDEGMGASGVAAVAGRRNSNSETAAVAAPTNVNAGEVKSSYVKMKIASDGGLQTAPVQKSLANFFGRPAPESAAFVASTTAVPAPPTKKKMGIAAFFGGGKGVASVDVTPATSGGDGGDGEGDAASSPAIGSTAVGAVAGVATTDSEAIVEGSSTAVADVGKKRADGDDNPGGGGEKEKEGGEEEKEEEGRGEEEEEEPKEPKDRSAKFRAMLEAERAANKRSKKLRNMGMVDEEAEEEEEEEGVRGLGDFGFGVPAGGTGTSATGGAGGTHGDEEDDVDDEIREEVSLSPPVPRPGDGGAWARGNKSVFSFFFKNRRLSR